MDAVTPWVQNYTAVNGSIILTAVVALLPILYFLVVLTVFNMKGWLAALTTMILALVVAVFVDGMPADSAISAATYGILGGLWPIGWISLWAIFIYNVAVESGKFQIIRHFIASVSPDQRIQVLLIAYGFGVFLEGVAGFGTPIAIGAALLLGCGMRSPILAAAVCLVANLASAPTGAIGIPVTVLANVTNIDAATLSVVISRQLVFVVLVIPFWLVAMVDGLRGIKDTFPLLVVLAVLGAIATLGVYQYVGHELSDVLLGIVLMAVVIGFTKLWKPKNQLIGEDYVKNAKDNVPAQETHYTALQILHAWSPYIVVTVLALVWTQPAVKAFFKQFTIPFEMFSLHNQVIKGAPLAAANELPAKAIWNFDIIGAVGTALFFSALYTVIAFKVSVERTVKLVVSTVKQLIFPILTICFVLGFARVSDYSGQTASIALLLSETGNAFPAFSPLLGMLGVFLTGSVVNSNTLFGKVQVITAGQIGVNANLLAASNTMGAIAGKVISPQSIAIGCASTKSQGREGELLKATLKHAFIAVFFLCVINYLQAFALADTVPAFVPKH